MGGISFRDKCVVVGLAACGEWVIDFDDSFLGDKYGIGAEGLMFNALFLKVTHANDAAC